MPDQNRPPVGSQQTRTIQIETRAVNAEERRVSVSFSSEQPVSRWYGMEILAHDEDSVNLSRLNDLGVSLFNHNRNIVLGRIENATIDAAQRKAYCDIVFDSDDEAEKVFQKVLSGTLKGVSVGYFVDVWEEVMAGKSSSNGRFTGPAYIATRWTPCEVSIVSVPADDSVGVGRELDEPNKTVSVDGRADTTNEREEHAMPNENHEPAVDVAAERQAAITAERQRVSEITALCRDFEIDPAEHINSGASVDQVRDAVLEVVRTQRQPLTGGVPDASVQRDEADKFREAAADAILLRSGRSIEKPAEGAPALRGMKLRDLAIDCLMRAGRTNAHRLDDETIFREALTPDSQFASILSNAVNKSMAVAYRAAQPTYQLWTGRGSNPDFKDATHYQISEAGGLTKMTQSGEFKFDEMQDQGVSKALATFGRAWGFTRTALINDDIGILTRVPDAYVRAAARGINSLVYSMLGNNPVIYDGTALFDAAHNNLGTTGAISTTTLSEGRKLMRTQNNLRGLETLNIAPAFLLAPAAKEVDALKYLKSPADPAGAHAGITNVFQGSLTPIIDAELDGYSATAWFLAASPADIDTIEVTYLNGDDMPKLESQVGFDFLGIKWRIYIDYGVTVLDFRGLFKNAG